MSTLPHHLRRQSGISLSGKQAWAIIEKYFAQYSTPEAQQELWSITVAALSTDQEPRLQKGINRHNLLFFHELTSLLLHAVYQLHQKRKTKK